MTIKNYNLSSFYEAIPLKTIIMKLKHLWNNFISIALTNEQIEL